MVLIKLHLCTFFIHLKPIITTRPGILWSTKKEAWSMKKGFGEGAEGTLWSDCVIRIPLMKHCKIFFLLNSKYLCLSLSLSLSLSLCLSLCLSLSLSLSSWIWICFVMVCFRTIQEPGGGNSAVSWHCCGPVWKLWILDHHLQPGFVFVLIPFFPPASNF